MTSGILRAVPLSPDTRQTGNVPQGRAFPAADLTGRQTVRSPPCCPSPGLPEQGVRCAAMTVRTRPCPRPMLGRVSDCVVTQAAAENHQRDPPYRMGAASRHRASPAGAVSCPRRCLSRVASVMRCRGHLSRAGVGIARRQAAGPAASGIRSWLASCTLLLLQRRTRLIEADGRVSRLARWPGAVRP